MFQQVEPHNDFFTAQFLVPFPQVRIELSAHQSSYFKQAGLYNMNISTEWKDSDGGSWSTGAKQTITVKSFEDRTTNTRPAAPTRT